MKWTSGQPASMKRWFVGGLLAALLLANGFTSGTVLAQETQCPNCDEWIEITPVSYPDWLCMSWWCRNVNTGEVIPVEELFDSEPSPLDAPDGPVD
jgi:hypothetical protein